MDGNGSGVGVMHRLRRFPPCFEAFLKSFLDIYVGKTALFKSLNQFVEFGMC